MAKKNETLVSVIALAVGAWLLGNRMKKTNESIGRTWFGGNSGYDGYSKSNRAIEAENRGLRNKSQMNKEFAEEVNEILQELQPGKKVTLKAIKDNLTDMIADEWHHTSMYGNKTNYYSAETVAEYFATHDIVDRRKVENERLAKEREIREYFLNKGFDKVSYEYGIVYVEKDGKTTSTFIDDEEDYLDKAEERINEDFKRDEFASYLYNTLEPTFANDGVKFVIGYNPKTNYLGIYIKRGKITVYTIELYTSDVYKDIDLIINKIDEVLEPYRLNTEIFFETLESYRDIVNPDTSYYSPYTDRMMITTNEPILQGDYIKKGISNDWREYDYMYIDKDKLNFNTLSDILSEL